MASWHTELERQLIRDRGGTPKQQYGPDGVMPDGDPVEVRVAKTDDRFRIGRDTHMDLLEGGGSYIFDVVGDGKPAREISADRVDDMLGGGKWFEDRDYPHKFLDATELF